MTESVAYMLADNSRRAWKHINKGNVKVIDRFFNTFKSEISDLSKQMTILHKEDVHRTDLFMVSQHRLKSLNNSVQHISIASNKLLHMRTETSQDMSKFISKSE